MLRAFRNGVGGSRCSGCGLDGGGVRLSNGIGEFIRIHRTFRQDRSPWIRRTIFLPIVLNIPGCIFDEMLYAPRITLVADLKQELDKLCERGKESESGLMFRFIFGGGRAWLNDCQLFREPCEGDDVQADWQYANMVELAGAVSAASQSHFEMKNRWYELNQIASRLRRIRC